MANTRSGGADADEMAPVVFLGGTVGENDWRTGSIERLTARGVPRGAIFDPRTDSWDDAAREREERAKRAARYLLFYLGDPGQGENSLSAYAMVESALAVCREPERTVLVFDLDGVTGHAHKAMQQTERILREADPSVPIFHDLESAEEWLVERLGRAT